MALFSNFPQPPIKKMMLSTKTLKTLAPLLLTLSLQTTAHSAPLSSLAMTNLEPSAPNQIPPPAKSSNSKPPKLRPPKHKTPPPSPNPPPPIILKPSSTEKPSLASPIKEAATTPNKALTAQALSNTFSNNQASTSPAPVAPNTKRLQRSANPK